MTEEVVCPEETFWCAILGFRGPVVFYGGTTRRKMGQTREWLHSHYGVPVEDVWVTAATTREEAKAYFDRRMGVSAN